MTKTPMRRVDIEIPDGDAGIDVTVENMWRLANRDAVSTEIISISEKYKTSDTTETTKKIFDYVWKNYKYKSDPVGREQITAPIHMVNGNNPQEDCDGLVTLLVSLLTAAGIKSRIKVIAWRKHDYTHVIAEFYDGSKWWPLDPTKKADGWKNEVRPQIRSKIYENPKPMVLTTLQDNVADCGCKSKKRKTNENNIEINIGNSTNADSFSSNHNELMKGVSAYETNAMNTPLVNTNHNTNTNAPIMPPSAPKAPINTPIDVNGIVNQAMAKNTANTTTAKKVLKQRYPAWV